MNKIFPYIMTVLILGFDQIVKLFVRQSMYEGQSIPVIQDIFHITYIENQGVAFGLFAGHTMVLVVISILILIGLFLFMWREKSQAASLRYGVAFIASGALGNIIDRAMKASVTDMFDFRIWPIFNVADIAVCVGFLLLVIYLLFSSEEKNGEPQSSNSK